MREMDLMMKYNMLDKENFLIWYDDLGGDMEQNATMTKAFISNFYTLQEKFPFLDADKNIGMVVAGGWIGVHEWRHLNGIISSMNVRELIAALGAV
jgi:hypothetical protein